MHTQSPGCAIHASDCIIHADDNVVMPHDSFVAGPPSVHMPLVPLVLCLDSPRHLALKLTGTVQHAYTLALLHLDVPLLVSSNMCQRCFCGENWRPEDRQGLLYWVRKETCGVDAALVGNRWEGRGEVMPVTEYPGSEVCRE